MYYINIWRVGAGEGGVGGGGGGGRGGGVSGLTERTHKFSV